MSPIMQLAWILMALSQLILLLLKYIFVKHIDLWLVCIPVIVTILIVTYDRMFRCFYAEYVSNEKDSTNQEAEFV
jgi:hypothetical protein